MRGLRRCGLVLGLAVALLGAGAEPVRAAPEGGQALRQARDLLQQGRHEEAAALLASSHGGDPLDRRALEGLVALARRDYARAARLLEEVVDRRPQQAAGLAFYLAQAWLALGRNDEALEALARCRAQTESSPGAALLRGRALLAQGHPHEAYRALAQGLERWPADADLARDMALLLLHLGLPHAALAPARASLAQRPRDPFAQLLLADALRSAGQAAEATALTQQVALGAPGDAEAAYRFALALAAQGLPLAAARRMEQAALLDPRHARAAAELYRRAGRFSSALRLNGRVLEPREGLLQRFAILLDAQRWARLLALEPALRAAGLLDPALDLRLAHAELRLGRHAALQQRLERLRRTRRGDPDLAALQAAAQACLSGASLCP